MRSSRNAFSLSSIQCRRRTSLSASLSSTHPVGTAKTILSSPLNISSASSTKRSISLSRSGRQTTRRPAAGEDGSILRLSRSDGRSMYRVSKKRKEPVSRLWRRATSGAGGTNRDNVSAIEKPALASSASARFSHSRRSMSLPLHNAYVSLKRRKTRIDASTRSSRLASNRSGASAR